MPKSTSSRTSHGSLTSGYMDEDGVAGPIERYKYRKPSPVRKRCEENEYYLPPSQRRGRKLEMDPYTFPMLPSRKDKDAADAKPKPKFDFTSEQLKNMGDFLRKAPAYLAERKAARAAEEAEMQKKIETIKALGGDVERFKKAQLAAKGREGSGSYQKVRSLSNAQHAQDDASKSEDEQPIFRPHKREQQSSVTRTRSKHIQEAVPGDSDIDDDPHFLTGIFEDTAKDASADEDKESVVEVEHTLAATNGKKSKKQRRAEAKARKEVEKTAQAKMHAKSREQSPSPGSKVHGWNMDPVAKPASQASTMSLQHKAWNAHYEGDAWGGADMGGTFEEPEKESSSRRSKRTSSGTKSKHSLVVDDIPAGSNDLHSSQRRSKSGEGSRRSGSRRESARSAIAAAALETIQEESPFVGGWGEEQVWEPPKSSSRKDSSSHRSPRDVAPRSHSQFRKESSSHRSHRSAEREPAERSQQASRRSSHHSRRSGEREPTAKSPVKGSTASYRPPTVEEVPEHWSGGRVDGAADWDKQPEKARSHHSSHSRHSRSSFEQAVNQAGYGDERAPSYRSYRTPHSRCDDAKVHSLRSKSTEKVNKWFESVPPPSAKALSEVQDVAQAGSHRSSRRSRVISGGLGGGAWENGEVPPDASVGTGYGKKGGDNAAGAWDQRSASRSGGRREASAVQADQGAWDDRTSTGSSTKADVGVKRGSSGTHRSRRVSHRVASATGRNGGFGV